MIVNAVLVSGRHTQSELFAHVQACIHFQILSPYGLLQTIDYTSLCMQQVLVDYLFYISVQFSSVAQLCPTLCDSMDGSMPGFPAFQQFPELA